MNKHLEFFKALSDKTRLRIIWLLSSVNFPLCVCEIMDSLEESQYNVSRHLKVLKSAGLVQEFKDGRWVYYSLSDLTDKFHELIFKSVSTIPEESLSLSSKRINKRVSLRKNDKCVVGINSNEWDKALKQLKLKEEKNV